MNTIRKKSFPYVDQECFDLQGVMKKKIKAIFVEKLKKEPAFKEEDPETVWKKVEGAISIGVPIKIC